MDEGRGDELCSSAYTIENVQLPLSRFDFGVVIPQPTRVQYDNAGIVI